MVLLSNIHDQTSASSASRFPNESILIKRCLLGRSLSLSSRFNSLPSGASDDSLGASSTDISFIFRSDSNTSVISWACFWDSLSRSERAILLECLFEEVGCIESDSFFSNLSFSPIFSFTPEPAWWMVSLEWCADLVSEFSLRNSLKCNAKNVAAMLTATKIVSNRFVCINPFPWARSFSAISARHSCWIYSIINKKTTYHHWQIVSLITLQKIITTRNH